ncbi:hypothetical protein PHLGIDRAFT_107242 [Phlebiopsis gigantea 11061_1 CR5-6]|uniref:Uncharacterized protein n=1 Tax=Phlebiopsis gigantea (strain 11061_1 CR5-6) TaxID=745531 RepID=A0A0C3PJA1_PHLG1|nr:hypothetical protein PHLGIDRAFT_107242 [Phlebiopsis gigantea 11061_1 CR5-6]
MQEALRRAVHIEHFPTSTGAGRTIPTASESTGGYSQYASRLDNSQNNVYAPFESKLEWDVVRWSKLRGPGSTACTELLGIDEIQERLGLSFKNTREIDQIVDSLPAPRPCFHREEIEVDGEAFDVYFRNVIECIRALYSEPEFSQHLVFLPERHYSDPDRTLRLFHEMHSGKWWWAAQKAIEADTPGATIIPLIISSDKTQLTLFRNKAAYPVYLTIGNLPKDIRSKPSRGGHVLLAYLPTTKLSHITNKAARRRTLANLFHTCMRHILSPLETIGLSGTQMTSADGATRRVHPIYAAYVSDYPEQVLVTCTKSGDCPIGTQSRHGLGELNIPCELRDISEALDVLGRVDELSRAEYAAACKEIHLKPVYRPFWENLPYSNVFTSITPDILHQLLQGIVKHLVAWIKEAYSADEIDARCARFPPNHNVRVFFKGITPLSRLTGREHADICRILLGLVIGMRLPDNASPARLVRAVRALLDFVYVAQYPLHFLRHYRFLIELLGSADNYNTEYTERLHIDMAKDAYRASNKKDEYDQMTLWLERREKITRHERYIKWRLTGQQTVYSNVNGPLYKHRESHVLMTREPSVKAVLFDRLNSEYGALDFERCVALWIAGFNHPTASARENKAIAAGLRLGFDAVPVYHKAKFWESDFPRYRHASDEYDVVHSRPSRQDKRGRGVPGRFDTALVNLGAGGAVGVDGYRVAQIRVIFSIPKRRIPTLFPGRTPPEHLVYLEWFTPFRAADTSTHGLFKIGRSTTVGSSIANERHGARSAVVVPLTDVRRSIHLWPCFGVEVPRSWSSDSVLDDCPKFFVSPFTDRHSYGTVV